MAANQNDKDHALSRITDDDAWLIIRSYQKDWNMWVELMAK